jgi:phospholipid transport system substrate-binding protein
MAKRQSTTGQEDLEKHMRKPLKSMLMLLSIGLLLPLATRAGVSPKKVIHDGSEEIRTILKNKVKKGSKAEDQQKQKLKKVVDGFLDYKELSRRALGPHWKARSDAERVEFTDLLRELIEESYTGSIRNNVNYNLEIEEEEIADDGSTADVLAVASAKNKKGKTVAEDLTFHLYLKKSIWLIYDVEFGDLSLVRHYRGEFNRKIKKESYAALLTVMKKKLAEIRSGKVEKKIKL